jgi:hypothetical protein
MREFCQLFFKIVKNAPIQCNKWRKMHCDSAKCKNLHYLIFMNILFQYSNRLISDVDTIVIRN